MRAIPRDLLLNPEAKQLVEEIKQNKVVVITQFHPTDSSFKDTIHKNWHLLGSPGTRVIHQTEIIYGNRCPKNLKDHLVRAQVLLPKPSLWVLKQAPELHGQTQVKRCPDSFTCRYCKLIDRSGTIRSKFDRHKFWTRRKVCCKSNNVIYAIEFTRCGMHYVGETKRDWRDRLTDHFRNITREDGFPTWPPFLQNEWPHRLTGCETVRPGVCQTPPEDSHRQHHEQAERKWQYRLHSNYPIGMNRDDYLPAGNTLKPQPH